MLALSQGTPKKNHIQLNPGEEVIYVRRANYHSGTSPTHPGRLYLTNQRVYFITTAMAFQKFEFDWSLEEIDSVYPNCVASRTSTTAKRLCVVLKSGMQTQFVAWHSKTWLQIFRDVLEGERQF